MKLYDIKGSLVSVNISPSNYPLKSKGPSKLHEDVRKTLIKVHGRHSLLEEFTIPGSKTRLDFYYVTGAKAYEISGSQHFEHNSFHHGPQSSGKFARQVQNDVGKANWCEINGIDLVVITEDMTEEEIILAIKG